MLAVIGLGNVGRKYVGTRHNVGFQVVDALARGRDSFESRGTFSFAGSRIGGRRVLLVKPATYMNRSGAAAAQVLDDFSLDLSDLLVVSDDIHLPLGKLRLRGQGGSGGQKGLESIIGILNSEEFSRLRLGIGPPPDVEDWAEYVLQPFRPDQREVVNEMIERAACCVRAWATDGVDRAMECFNNPPG